MNGTGETELDAFDLLVSAVIAVSFAAIGLLMLGAFKAIVAVAVGAFALSTLLWLTGTRVKWRKGKIDQALIAIVFLALCFRAQPWRTIVGGSDEGIYVNMSRAFETQGSSIFVDQVRDRMSPYERQLYDLTNQVETWLRVPHRFEGIHLPGVDIKDLSASRYDFQFYPLHPLWMAISARLLGEGARLASLVFFSLLSIVGFYLLTRELAGGRLASARIVALLLAVHPTHAFFTRFPTSEVIQGCFSALALYYLLRAMRSAEPPLRDLLISAGLFGCLFFTHVREFLFLPLLGILAVITTFVASVGAQQRLIGYWCLVLAAFFGSLAYGLYYTYPYFDATFPSIPALSFGNVSARYVNPVAIGAVAVALIIALRRRLASPLDRLMRSGRRFAPFLLLAALLMTAVLSVVFSWTGRLTALSYHPGESGHGSESFQFTNFYMEFLLFSPIGMAALGYALFRFRRSTDGAIALLISWIALIMLLLDNWTGNLPDYIRTRYVLAEVLPYSLVLISLALGELWSTAGKSRTVAAAAVGLMALFFCRWTLPQFGEPIKDEGSLALGKLAAHVGDHDVLLLPASETHISVPFAYFYGRNVIRYADLDASLLRYQRTLLSDYGQVFVLTDEPQNRDELIFADSVQSICRYFGGQNWMQAFPSVRTLLWNAPYYLYRVDQRAYRHRVTNRTKVLASGVGWTTGDYVVQDIGYEAGPKDRLLTITTTNTHPFIKDPAKLNLRVIANANETLLLDHVNGGAFYFRLPPNLKTIDRLEVLSNTFVPRELGINADPRHLGIDVKEISVE